MPSLKMGSSRVTSRRRWDSSLRYEWNQFRPSAPRLIFDWLGMFFGADAPASSARTRSLLVGEPTHATLREDIAAEHSPLS
jgi:hypothetical protein